MKRPLTWFAVGAALLTLLVYVTLRPKRDVIERIDEAPARAPREFTGVVRRGLVPVPGARVELYEDVPDGFLATTETDANGAFAMTWVPTATTDRRKLFLAVDGTVVRARSGGSNISLGAPAPVTPQVFDTAGQPVEANVVTRIRNGRTDVMPAFGTPVDVLVTSPGYATRFERRFVGGHTMPIHLAPGFPVSVRIRDPAGRAVDANVGLDLPHRLRMPRRTNGGRITLPDASDGGLCYLRVEEPGYLPVLVPAWPGVESEVILWPARTVKVLAWNAWNSVGVEDVDFDLDIDPKAKGDWWGGEIGKLRREWPVRPGKGGGVYLVSIPACKCVLRLSAPRYGSAEVNVPRSTREVTVRMQPPSRRDKPGQLVLRAKGHLGRLPLVLNDPATGWTAAIMLEDGLAELDVKPMTKLRLASANATDGKWLPQRDIEPIARGERRVLQLRLQPATRLIVATRPPVRGYVDVIDVAYKRAARAHRRPLQDGRAEFWVRPLRRVRVSVKPVTNHFELAGEFETERKEMTWTARLRAGAGLRYRVIDRAGNPIPFARVRLWEPSVAGEVMLRRPPRTMTVAVDGEVRFLGLHDGKAPVEVVAPGFRTRRPGLVDLIPRRVFDGGEIVMESAGIVKGRIIDVDGNGRGGLRLRVLAPQLRRLRVPNGGERTLYDLAGQSGRSSTDADGRFAARDAASRGPLLAVFAAGQAGLTDFVFDLPEDDEPLVLPEAAHVELAVGSGSVQGVYLLLPDARRAVLIKRDPPMGLRPLPIALPAGRHSLFVRMRDGRWAAPIINVKAGKTYRIKPEFH